MEIVGVIGSRKNLDWSNRYWTFFGCVWFARFASPLDPYPFYLVIFSFHLVNLVFIFL